MKYPKYLALGNWLFKHIEPDFFTQQDNPVGGPIPENLYIVINASNMSLSKHLRTYENLITCKDCEIPNDQELLRLLK